MPELFSFIQNSLADLTPAWLFFALFLGTFISEDATCVLAGAFAASGQTSFALAVTACFAGIIVGDIILYGVGRLAGDQIFNNKLTARIVSIEARHRAASWLERNAAEAVFISRFVSGLRLPTYLAAGAMRAGFGKFAACFFLAAAVWTPLLVGAAAFSQKYLFPGQLLLGIVVAIVAVRFLLKMTSWKDRRIFIGRLKRVYRWEFWPLAAFYFPVVCYGVYLAIRFRGLTVFTAANPAMPAGGVVGESKDQIYRAIRKSRAATKHLLKYGIIKAGSSETVSTDTASEFVAANSLEFPVVVKPDAGERGNGVVVARNMKEFLGAINSEQRDTIVQEFCPGVEASAFYYRYPNESKGRLFTITEKSFPHVTGDGVSTLDSLVLRDKRAVSIASVYFDSNREHLDRIPASGERVNLVEIGTHSRGAVFSDGEWMRSAELESTIDKICQGIRGFYFGRFDIRGASFAEIASGSFKIIELNGVTSESTNIYDRRYSLIDAYRILFRQWKIAFSIGAMNRNRGVKPITLMQFVKLIVTRNTEPLAGDQQDEGVASLSSTNACA